MKSTMKKTKFEPARQTGSKKTLYQAGQNIMKLRLLSSVYVIGLLMLIQWFNFYVPAGQVLAQAGSTYESEPHEHSALNKAAAANAYQLRTVYMIPSNRSPQSGAEQKLQQVVLRMQDWYSDHMERLGYGPKTFQFEAEQDGTTPKVNIVNVAEPDTFFHADRWSQWTRIQSELGKAGFPHGQHGEVLFVVAEIQEQLENGSFIGHFVGGLGTSFEGMGVITGDHLGRLSEAYLVDDREYQGHIIEEIGPYPLVYDVSFHGYEGETFSSISSSAYGAAIHEVGHGFGLWHDGRNDTNFNGNLMGGGGLRGFRGTIFPDRYPNDDTRLASGSGLLLNHNRFFNPGRSYNDNIPPLVVITSSGTVVPQNGLCPIDFTASDAGSSLAGVLLIRNGNVIADMPLNGQQVSGTISTYDYEPGEANQLQLLAFDKQGNRQWSQIATITCAVGFNRAPKPYIEVSKTTVNAGQNVILNANRSSDPDGSDSHLRVEWDLDGDGNFDTIATTSKTRNTVFTQPGIYQVVARITDQLGDSSLSMPIGIRVEPAIDKLVIEKLINNRTSKTPQDAPQILAGTSYRVDYKVTNNSPDRLYRVRVFEDGQLVCNLYDLMPGQSKQPGRCTHYKDALAGLNNVPANVTAKVSGSNQERAGQTDAYYTGFVNVAGRLKVTHYVNNRNADTPGGAAAVTGNQAEILFKVENTGSIKLYRVKTYHDPASPVNSGWQEQCFIGTMIPGEVRYCKRTIDVTESGLNKAFGRVQGQDAYNNPTEYINASNPTYFIVP